MSRVRLLAIPVTIAILLWLYKRQYLIKFVDDMIFDAKGASELHTESHTTIIMPHQISQKQKLNDITLIKNKILNIRQEVNELIAVLKLSPLIEEHPILSIISPEKKERTVAVSPLPVIAEELSPPKKYKEIADNEKDFLVGNYFGRELVMKDSWPKTINLDESFSFESKLDAMLKRHTQRNINRLLSIAYSSERTYHVISAIQTLSVLSTLLKATPVMPWIYRNALQPANFIDSEDVHSVPADRVFDLGDSLLNWKDFENRTVNNKQV